MSYARLQTYKAYKPPKPDDDTQSKSAAMDVPAFQLQLSDPMAGNFVVLAFKLLDTAENEHWVNKLAAKLTSPKNKNIPGVYPSGRLCHVELMIRATDDDWRMFSINMMEGRRPAPDADPVYEWGKVHVRSVLPCKMNKYTYVAVTMPRENQHTMYTFLTSQIDGKFNFAGYTMNYVLPCAFGQRYGHKLNMGKKYKWMCAELIWSALQIGQLKTADERYACRMSPNQIYEFCRESSECAGTTNPLARC